MTHNDDGFRAVGALPISATAKYIGSVIVATGTSVAAEIVAITGLPRSTVYRCMVEFFANGGDSLICPTRPTSENPTRLTDGNCDEKPVSLVPPVGQTTPENPHAHASIASRATNELPTEVTLNEDNITPLIAPQPLKTKPAKRGSRLPDDWQLPDDWRDWTAVNCPASTPQQIATLALEFANYWQALPGAKACKLDWKKTWQNRCLAKFATAPTRPNSGGVFLSAAERQRQRERDSRAILDSMIAGVVQ